MVLFQLLAVLAFTTFIIAMPVLRIYHWVACYLWRRRVARYRAEVLVASAKCHVRDRGAGQ